MSTRTATVQDVALNDIRDALLLGLSLLGEFEERRDAFEALSLCAVKPPESLRPIDVIGHAGGVRLFAAALTDIALLTPNYKEPEAPAQ